MKKLQSIKPRFCIVASLVLCGLVIFATKWLVIPYRDSSIDAIGIEKIKGLKYKEVIQELGTPESIEYHYIQITDDISKKKPVNRCQYKGDLVVSFDWDGEMVSISKNGVNVWKRE